MADRHAAAIALRVNRRERNRRRIEEALAALPAAYREALLLVAVEGMKPAEAAAVCGVTPEAMRQRLSRARAVVASQLDECDDTILVHLKAVTT